jgi:hypothetical protein
VLHSFVYRIMYGGFQKCIQIWVVKPKGKRPRSSPRLMWKDDIRKDLRDVGLEGVN